MKIILNLGAIDGLLRVQDTYGLKSLDIARGHFGSMETKQRNQTWTLPKLTSQNCFEIGYQAYRKGSILLQVLRYPSRVEALVGALESLSLCNSVLEPKKVRKIFITPLFG